MNSQDPQINSGVNHSQPYDPSAPTQPVKVVSSVRRVRGRRLNAIRRGLFLGILLGVYFLFPGRINVLMLGIDRTPPGSAVGRTDTLILTTAIPLQGYLGVLSIPRDLWVAIPEVGENRINAAHFFAEASQPDSGPAASVATVAQNFGLDLHYYIRFQFDGFRGFIDALGGIPIELDQQVAKLPAGSHLLNGEQSLAFVRDRTGTDDFSRMEHGQMFMKAVMRHMLHPATWPRLPLALAKALATIDSNMPFWQWPRYIFTWIRVGPETIDARLITREMVRGFTTSEGAQVLAPDWSRINPVLLEMFGQ